MSIRQDILFLLSKHPDLCGEEFIQKLPGYGPQTVLAAVRKTKTLGLINSEKSCGIAFYSLNAAGRAALTITELSNESQQGAPVKAAARQREFHPLELAWPMGGAA